MEKRCFGLCNDKVLADWRADFFEARYHLSVARRMLETYDEFPEKRILVGIIREGGRAVRKLVRAFLIREGMTGNLDVFLRKIALKYLDEKTVENLVKILEIERAQRMSKVEFVKNDKILLLVDGRWKVLKVSRLREFLDSVNYAVDKFPTDIKR
ncbi:hypothetical protein KAT36_02740 [Candidatus Pacearchaeota archaeon]|nr:hypothetical protein [Candidatus Pacearchaeota archaeon]